MMFRGVMYKNIAGYLKDFPYMSIRYVARNIYHALKKLLQNSDPYAKIQLYKPDLKIKIIEKSYVQYSNFPKYSVLTPVLNEESNIVRVLQTIENQTYLPDEVVIVDGGSKDKTIDNIKQYQKNSKLNIVLVISPVRNLGHQRNLAVKTAKNNIVLHIDAGTLPDKHYAANMIGPFAEYENIDLVGGISFPIVDSKWARYFTFRNKKYHFKFHDKPNGNVVAYRKDLALQALYPEYLTYAGEDTVFFYRYQKLSKNWIFNRDAFILWDLPTNPKDTESKLRNYMLGNFEVGFWPYFCYNYILYSKLYKAGALCNITEINYLLFNENNKKFLSRQAEVEINKRHIKGICFVFSKFSIGDDQATQYKNYIFEMIKDNYKVFFINTQPKIKQNKRVYLDTDITLLELIPYKYFSIEQMKHRYGEFLDRSIFILEKEDKVITAEINELKRHCSNIKIMYDLLN